MIRVGTAGWSYPRGEGKWMEVFYPRGVEPLEFYARYFDTVEVNSTFYRLVPPRVTAGWAASVRPGFRFSIKLFQKFTHPKMFAEATGRADPPTPEDYARFIESIDPLRHSRVLGAVLAQFPPSFKRSERSLAYLGDLADRLNGLDLVVELRHRSWTSDAEPAQLLARHGVSWARIDEPKFRTSVGQAPATGPVSYFRFHGRNWKQWWKGDREARYDYLYSPGEQTELAEKVTEVAGTTRDTYVTYNNHYGAKAVANALQMKLMLGQEVREDPPEPLLNAFPDLRALIEREAAERAA